MPQGNDLGPVDPVETVTVTFDFAPWLGKGVTIFAVTSVACAAYQGVDASASSRIVGGSQIAASPSTGIAASAVLQQFGNMVAGVTYRLQCWVLTTDSQTLNIWTHQPCIAPT